MVVDGRAGERGEWTKAREPARGFGSLAVAFGSVTLRLDQVDNYAQAELWLEPLPDGLPALWIGNPAGIPHIVRAPDEN
jgi:hypothetical protein